MKFVDPHSSADPDAAARKLVEIANGVEAVHNTPSAELREQLDVLAKDSDIAAVKIGMLGNRELLAQGAAKLPYQGRRKHAGRPSAQVDTVHQFGNSRATQTRPQAADFPTNPGDVLLVSFHRRDAGGKVAVGAFGAAKRNRNVDAERIHPLPKSCYLF